MKIPFFDDKIFRFWPPGLAGPPAADLDWSSATGRGLWAFGFQGLKMGILEATGWGLWISLDYHTISNDDIHPLGWISRACLRRWFQAGGSHIGKRKSASFLEEKCLPPKRNSSNYSIPNQIQSTIIAKWLCFMASHPGPWNSSFRRSSWISARPHSRRIGFKLQP